MSKKNTLQWRRLEGTARNDFFFKENVFCRAFSHAEAFRLFIFTRALLVIRFHLVSHTRFDVPWIFYTYESYTREAQYNNNNEMFIFLFFFVLRDVFFIPKIPWLGIQMTLNQLAALIYFFFYPPRILYTAATINWDQQRQGRLSSVDEPSSRRFYEYCSDVTDDSIHNLHNIVGETREVTCPAQEQYNTQKNNLVNFMYAYFRF